MEQMRELLDLIKGMEIRGELLAASFIVRRVQPCKERAHPSFDFGVTTTGLGKVQNDCQRKK